MSGQVEYNHRSVTKLKSVMKTATVTVHPQKQYGEGSQHFINIMKERRQNQE